MQFNNFNNLNLTQKHRIMLMILIGILAAGNIFFGIAYFLRVQEVQGLTQQAQTQHTNKQVADFLSLFIQKVLKTDKEVSFDDRLQLENAIRSINDPELLDKWEKFTSGNTETEIQAAVKDLLEALSKKITY